MKWKWDIKNILMGLEKQFLQLARGEGEGWACNAVPTFNHSLITLSNNPFSVLTVDLHATV